MSNASTSGVILVVDDEELNRDMLSRRLTRKGFDVVCADGAAQADVRLQESSVDLILLDIMMPDVDGFQYLEQLRERWDASQMPVIMATAKDTSEDIVKALKMGASDYVTKPLDFQVVVARVNTHLRLKRATEELAEAHKLLQEDLQRAARFQQSQLPAANLTVPGCRFAWSYLPCDALAGDFLGVVPLDETRTAFYVLDVCGHGTPAALMSASVARTLAITNNESSVVTRFTSKGFMRGSRLDVVPPSEVTASLNRQFDLDSDEGKYFTIAYMILDRESSELTYTLAGHPPQVLSRSAGKCELLECKGVPVGVLNDDDVMDDAFQQKTVSVATGDRIYLYSDGLAEATNKDDQQLGTQGILDFVSQARSLPIDESINRVLELIREFCGDVPFDDDLSLLVIEVVDYKPSENNDH